MKRSAVILVTSLLLFSCDKEVEYDKAKAVSAFAIADQIKVDEDLAKTAITIPSQKSNHSWSGSASAQNQAIENFSATLLFKKSSVFWSFYSGEKREHFVFSPVIKDGKIFILDSAGELIAYDLASDKKIWQSQIFPKKFLKNYRTPRVGYSQGGGNGKIFAIAGVNQIAAVDEISGKVLWTKTLSSIPISTPISDGKLVFVSTNDNKLYAFDIRDGRLTWVQTGIARATAIFGEADPVISGDKIIAAYSSGEIYAVNKNTGESLWSQDLNLNKATSSDFYLNDIDATPLVKDGVVYAIGNGGLTAAIRLADGNFLWKRQIAGLVDFWAAGEFLFMINNENKLLALNKKTGGIKWIAQLPDFENPKKPQTKILYSGIVMAGGKLLISRADGALLVASPLDGAIEKTIKLGKKISHSPVVVDEKIYLYSISKYTADLVEIK